MILSADVEAEMFIMLQSSLCNMYICEEIVGLGRVFSLILSLLLLRSFMSEMIKLYQRMLRDNGCLRLFLRMGGLNFLCI